MPRPPRRIYLGSDALHAIRTRLRATASEIERYEPLSRSIDTM